MSTGLAPCQDFSGRVVTWQRSHGRHHLPWQAQSDPYRVWLSEIMLQQTQVNAVVGYYRRFLECFPDVAALAGASQDAVLACWSGLGYYARARNLHRAAQEVMTRFAGRFPTDSASLQTLPGIGRSTAAAIAAFTACERSPILDGNVKRVLTRHFMMEGFPGATAVERRLWLLAGTLLPSAAEDMPAYTQGLMDLGAQICTRTRPKCSACPLQSGCQALREGAVADFPQPRPRRTRPVREQSVYLLRDAQQRLLLERRAQTGVWGGLWSFPEHAPAAALARGQALRVFELSHGFTHFQLAWRVEEWRLEAAAELSAPAPAPDRQWWPLDEALRLGLPAPARRVLEQLVLERGANEGALSDPAAPAGTHAAGPAAPEDH